MKKAGIVVAALLVIAIAGSAFAAPARKVYYEKPYGQIAYKPKRIDFSDLTLTKIKWRHWNSKVARGRGRARVFSAGGSATGTARLKMFKRHVEGNRRMYGCMTGTTNVGGHKEHVEWPPACAG
jgi:hypothetical protein